MAGLGRGFDDLIPTDLIDDNFDVTADEDVKTGTLTELNLSDIQRDESQPRKEFNKDALQALANSIIEHGVLQPIVVTKNPDIDGAKYVIVAGERRWRASKLANKTTIPAIIRTLDVQNRLELSIIENAQREDLNAIELATAYAKLKSQFNMSVAEIAKRVGKSEAGVTNTMRLLNLPDDAKKEMVKNNLTEGVMRPLVNADPELIAKVLPKIIDEGWTARKVERYMADNKKKSSVVATKTSIYHKDEDRLSSKYNARVRVHGRSITITTKSDDELKNILKQL